MEAGPGAAGRAGGRSAAATAPPRRPPPPCRAEPCRAEPCQAAAGRSPARSSASPGGGGPLPAPSRPGRRRSSPAARTALQPAPQVRTLGPGAVPAGWRSRARDATVLSGDLHAVLTPLAAEDTPGDAGGWALPILALDVHRIALGGAKAPLDDG